MFRNSCAVLPDVKKIAVLRANGLGDFIFTLPALESLRAAYPSAEITLLGGNLHRELLQERPGPVDRVIVVPPSRGVREEAGLREDLDELEGFFAATAKERFDLALQLHGGGRNSNPFVLRLGAKVTAGLKTPDAAPLDRWVPYYYFQPEVMRYLEVVSLVGGQMVGLEPRLRLTERDLAESRRVVPDDGPLAALNPGAGDPRRRWPAERLAAVGDALAAAGARVVVTEAPAGRELAARVVGAMQQQAANLAGRLSLGGLAGLYSRCSVVVSNDSGPLHLAQAVGAPTVGLFWCFNLINAGPFTRRRHRAFLSWQIECPTCGLDCMRGRCDHTSSFVADIPTEEVAAETLDLFRAGAGAGPDVDEQARVEA